MAGENRGWEGRARERGELLVLVLTYYYCKKEEGKQRCHRPTRKKEKPNHHGMEGRKE